MLATAASEEGGTVVGTAVFAPHLTDLFEGPCGVMWPSNDIAAVHRNAMTVSMILSFALFCDLIFEILGVSSFSWLFLFPL